MKKIIFIVSLFVFCIGFYCVFNTTPDNDLWARLIAGEYIVENLSLPKFDFLSYTPTHTWFDHEWGASVIFYLILKYFGDSGLMIFGGILLAFTVFFCYKTVEIRKVESTVPYNILYYAIMVFVVLRSLGAVVRCLMFTCLFFAIFLYLLERYRQKGGKCLIWLPFLMILWSNIHGGCISAFGLLALYILGEFLNKKTILPYILTFLACFAVLFINPYGFDYVKFLFFAASMDRSYILEWQSPFHKFYLYDYIRYKLYLVFIFIVQILYFKNTGFNYKKIDKTKLLVVLAMAYLSITHLRHITFFVFTSATLMYDEVYFLLNLLKNKFEPLNKIIEYPEFLLLKDIIIYLFLLILTVPSLISTNKGIRITETAYPMFAIEFIKINNIHGNLFISFDWGSYAAYKLYPNNLIVMDGRYEEVYNPNLLLELKNFFYLKNDWYKIIRDYQTDVMVIETKYPVYKKMLKHKDWENIFDNKIFAVFVPKKDVRAEYVYPIPNDDYYNSKLFETGWVKDRNYIIFE